ncbi:MAG: hypothetical protein GC155_10690 [Alphaproteobacteria bacterium]|nr:hypothetical protein [Alphaproteobacteria bacterium]
MTAKLIARLRAPERAVAATPLLRFIAGDFADEVAYVWRAPHAEFFALPAARRHAAAVVLAGLGRRPLEISALRRMIEFARDPDVAAAIAGDDWRGIMPTLAKAGEPLWATEEYERFLRLFAEPAARQALRHMEMVRPGALAPLAELPPALRVAPILRILTGVDAAADLAHAFHLVTRMRGPEGAQAVARRWGAGGDAAAVFGRAMQDLVPDRFRPADPAPQPGDPFHRIASRKLLEQVALEFRNCLRDHAVRIAEGRMAVFVWRVQPAAVIALNWDVAGWRLAEAKAAENADLDEDRLRELVQILDLHGVRSGCSVQALTSRLDDHASGTNYCSRPGPGFVDQLSLGDLWS